MNELKRKAIGLPNTKLQTRKKSLIKYLYSKNQVRISEDTAKNTSEVPIYCARLFQRTGFNALQNFSIYLILAHEGRMNVLVLL